MTSNELRQQRRNDNVMGLSHEEVEAVSGGVTEGQCIAVFTGLGSIGGAIAGADMGGVAGAWLGFNQGIMLGGYVGGGLCGFLFS